MIRSGSNQAWSSLSQLFALPCTVCKAQHPETSLEKEKKKRCAAWERSSVVGEGGEERGRKRGGLRGELNFVNGVFLRASHSALKAKPPGWGLWSAGIRHAQSVPLLKSPPESYLFEQPFLNLFLYQLVGCDLAKCFGNRRHRWMVKWRRFLSFCFLLPRWFPHTLVLPISPPVPSPSI